MVEAGTGNGDNELRMVTVVEEFRSRGGRPAGRNHVAAPGIPAGTTNYTYYDSQWQAIETRTNGTANTNVTSQTVWSAAYINAPVSQYTPAPGFTGKWNVNVVEISFTPGDGSGQTVVPAGASANQSTDQVTGDSAVYFRNNVTMMGPTVAGQSGAGDSFMRIGYMQDANIIEYKATYLNTNNGTDFTLTSSVQGNTYIDYATIGIPPVVNTIPPWWDSHNTTGFAYWGPDETPALANGTVQMDTADSPSFKVYTSSPPNTSGEPVDMPMVSFDYLVDFDTYIASETTDPGATADGAQPQYNAVAIFEWSAYFSGTYSAAAGITLSSDSGFAPLGSNTAFVAAFPGLTIPFPFPTGVAGNVALNDQTWY